MEDSESGLILLMLFELIERRLVVLYQICIVVRVVVLRTLKSTVVYYDMMVKQKQA